MISEERAAEIYGRGWAYYLSDDPPDEFAPLYEGDELCEWIKGFSAAIADNDIEPGRVYSTIEEALIDCDINGQQLEACLLAAEAVLKGDVWCRWPSVPVRSKSFTAEYMIQERVGACWESVAGFETQQEAMRYLNEEIEPYYPTPMSGGPRYRIKRQ